jgi:hypothetical protein
LPGQGALKIRYLREGGSVALRRELAMGGEESYRRKQRAGLWIIKILENMGKAVL